MDTQPTRHPRRYPLARVSPSLRPPPRRGAGCGASSSAERLSHWLYALFFLVAFVTGLLMWIPATRELAGRRARYTLSQYHGYVGAAMIVVPLLLFLVLDRRRLGRDLREIDTWNGDDRRWFWLALRGYTLRGRQMPPQGRFNAGQKINVVLVAAMAMGFAATGGILMHKQDLQPWLVSRALWLHAFLAVVRRWPCSPGTWPTCSSPSTAAPTWPGWSGLDPRGAGPRAASALVGGGDRR